jgi:hypothetical protein
MSNEHKSSSPIAQKLRGIGLIPLPRWWVTPEEFEIISRITKHHLPAVMKIKEQIRQGQDLAEIEESYKHNWSYDE